MEECRLCPRNCGIDRRKKTGFCKADDKMRISKIMFHSWEEPCFCYGRGVAAYFFSGCSLGCVFCQNHEISRKAKGDIFSPEKLSESFLSMAEKGASAIDLVTPSHYAPLVAKALSMAKDRLSVPVIFNCGGYEKTETLKLFEGLVDIYLPDLKFIDKKTAADFASAPDYPEVSLLAIREMCRQTGELRFNEKETERLERGVIVRHLVLPGHREESVRLINTLKENFSSSEIMLSLMSQYTPVVKTDFPELNRRLTKFEYKYVLKTFEESGFEGYAQSPSSADTAFIPEF